MAGVPKAKLNNGLEVPILGFGTCKSKPGLVGQAVKDAIDIGYRHIDSDQVDGNEKEVREALKSKLTEGAINREDLFITSKLWNTFHRPDLVEGAIKKTLKDLGLEYLDLYVIDWPLGYKEDKGLFPLAHGKMLFSTVDYVDTWKAMEELVKKGFTKSIGISNFNKRQIERILSVATIKPVVNQVECHLYLNQSKLIKFCKSKGITVTAYNPLAFPGRPWIKPYEPQLHNDARVKELAKKYKKTFVQIALRYQIQRGVVTIPKSVTKASIEENFNLFDFELSDDDIKYLDTFDCKARFYTMRVGLGHPHHPFENDEY